MSNEYRQSDWLYPWRKEDLIEIHENLACEGTSHRSPTLALKHVWAQLLVVMRSHLQFLHSWPIILSIVIDNVNVDEWLILKSRIFMILYLNSTSILTRGGRGCIWFGIILETEGVIYDTWNTRWTKHIESWRWSIMKWVPGLAITVKGSKFFLESFEVGLVVQRYLTLCRLGLQPWFLEQKGI